MALESIRPLQLKQLEILKEFKRVCELNNLTYFLAYGTLLGAVRHNGFIPWDDDVDVCMNYSDYVKLDEACKKDLKEGFFLQSAESDPQSHMTFKKLRLNSTTYIYDAYVNADMNHGISIDIYPIFNMSNKKAERKKQINAALKYLLFEVGKPPRNHGKIIALGSKIMLGLVKGKRREKLKKKYHNIMTKYNDVETNYRALMFGNAMNCRKVYPAEYFIGTEMMLFEDDYFSVPKEYDKYLTERYGDYMKLPPVEEQGCKLEHIVKLDTERPFTDYKGIYYCVNKK